MSGPIIRLYKDENLTSVQMEKLNELFTLFKDDNLKFILRHECLSIKNPENYIFVFAVFDGPAFNHLRGLNARIVGAECMLSSFRKGKKLTKTPVPLFSFAMQDLNVCCTNMEKKQREEIYDKVEMMRGKVSKIFTENVTHLVTTEVGSQKYHAAGTMKIPVMLTDWVLEVWKASENEDVHATDARFLKHRCPIFYKYVICASGFNELAKNKIKLQVESGGGTYRGDLACGTTTHLILNEPKGAKYDHAKLWKISIVKSEWIYDSINAGYCLPEKDYLLEADNQTSTPTENRMVSKTSKAKPPEIDLSVINGAANNNHNKHDNMIASANVTKCVNETEHRPHGLSQSNLNNSCSLFNASINNVHNNSKTTFKQPQLPKINSKYNDVNKEFESIKKINLTLFDGCGIFCENFDSVINEKLKKLSNQGGAIRFDEYNSDVTHVIVNQVNEKQCKTYIELNPEVNIVTIDWFIDSCRSNQLEDCKTYCAFKNALNSVKTPKKRARPENTTASTSSANLDVSNKIGFDSDLNDCLSQYLNVEAALMKQAVSEPATTTTPIQQNGSFHKSSSSGLMNKLQQYQQQQQQQQQKTIEHNVLNSFSNSPKLNMSSSSSTTSAAGETFQARFVKKSPIKEQGIFANKKFHIVGFQACECEPIENTLSENGATVYMNQDPDETQICTSRNRVPLVDYTIFPMTIEAPIANMNPATVFWMETCVKQNKLLPLSEDLFFQPIPKFNTDKPLVDCVITISGIDNQEKEILSTLCTFLGAHVQKSLSLRKVEDILKNTHLVCRQANGPKYDAAKKWKMPVVYPEWVIESCVTGLKADEKKYAVDGANTNHQLELAEGLAKIRSNLGDVFTGSTAPNANDTTVNNSDAKANDTPQARLNSFYNNTPNLSNFKKPDDEHPNDSSLSMSNKQESKKPRLDDNKENTDEDQDDDDDDDNDEDQNNEHNNHDQNGENNQDVTNDNDLILAAIENSARAQQNKNSATPCNPRLKELRRSEFNRSNVGPVQPQFVSPVVPSPATTTTTTNTGAFSTPVWLKPNTDENRASKEIRLNIDYERAMEMLKTPDALKAKHIKFAKKPVVDLNETPDLAVALHKASENIRKADYQSSEPYETSFEYSFEKKYKNRNAQSANDAQRGDEDDNEADKIQPTPSRVDTFRNVKIYVSKKLLKQQAELFHIVESLGGDFSWTYHPSCTHYIYSGKLNDNLKELKQAKEDQKLIVLPEWIYDCQRENKRLDESDYLVTAAVANNRYSVAKPGLEDPNQQNLPPECAPNEPLNDEQKENHNQTDEEPVKCEQVDLKLAFLDQLQDKLATLRCNTSNNAKKFSRNKSDVNKSDLTTNAAAHSDQLEKKNHRSLDAEDDDEDDVNDVEDDDESDKKALKRKANIPNSDSNDKLSDPKKQSKTTSGRTAQTNKQDQENGSKKDKASKKFDQIAPSQIQITYWKEDSAPTGIQPGSSSSSSSTNATRTTAGRTNGKLSSVGSSNNINIKTEPNGGSMLANGRNTKSDATIAERIVTAARAANSRKN